MTDKTCLIIGAGDGLEVTADAAVTHACSDGAWRDVYRDVMP